MTRRYSREYLLGSLKKLAKELGRVPTIYDLGKHRGYPISNTYAKRFGSWAAARREAGVDGRICRQCGTDITHRHRRARWCKNCADKRQVVYIREYQKKKRAEIRTPVNN